MKGAREGIVKEEARSGRLEKEVKETCVDLTLNEPLRGHEKGGQRANRSRRSGWQRECGDQQHG